MMRMLKKATISEGVVAGRFSVSNQYVTYLGPVDHDNPSECRCDIRCPEHPEVCGQCGATVEGHHACQGVPGWEECE
jgi:hypothetical protein